MAEFELQGVHLTVPEEQMSDGLRRALAQGRYEGAEARALRLHVKPGQRVFDLGAGAGFLMVVASRITGPGNVVGVEANPAMIKVASENLARNGAAGARVLAGAVVPDDYPDQTIPFYPRDGFWAASLAPPEGDHHLELEVPALGLRALLERYRPDVVVMDIEGGEEFLFDAPWPGHVELAIIELHARRYPASVIRHIFDAMSASGLAYMPEGSQGSVVVFRRITE